MRDLVSSSGDFEVVGEAGDGHAALEQVHALDPDLVTLDVQMPGLDGLATLGYLMSEAPRPVVMLSSLTDGGDTTMRALELGAVDFVRKPGLGDTLDLATLQERLLGALRTAAGAHYQSVPVLARTRPRSRPTPALPGTRPDARGGRGGIDGGATRPGRDCPSARHHIGSGGHRAAYASRFHREPRAPTRRARRHPRVRGQRRAGA
ncbi:MAG: response regulator [Gemmatimonadetes bacterium]|nr:response regulator [Gemmatimonadota bacterium]